MIEVYKGLENSFELKPITPPPPPPPPQLHGLVPHLKTWAGESMLTLVDKLTVNAALLAGKVAIIAVSGVAKPDVVIITVEVQICDDYRIW